MLILEARKTSPILSLKAETHLSSLEPHGGELGVKTLIKFGYKSKDKSVQSVLDEYNDNK